MADVGLYTDRGGWRSRPVPMTGESGGHENEQPCAGR
eukprot:COSAG03_NODE_379_length_8384_cov_1.929028_2_plen_37_part_00